MTWDDYFLALAKTVASNTKCLSRAIGAVIVRDGKYVVSTGYNGPPSGFPHPSSNEFEELAVNTYGLSPDQCLAVRYGECPRRVLGYKSGEGINICPCAHSERNAIDIAAKLGHPTNGCIMCLSSPTPCRDCAMSIVTAGIKEVVVTAFVDYETCGFTGQQILRESGVVLRIYHQLEVDVDARELDVTSEETRNFRTAFKEAEKIAVQEMTARARQVFG